jgi:hypothetical protein
MTKSGYDESVRYREVMMYVAAWLFILCAIACVILYPIFAENVKQEMAGMLVGWFAFAAGFFFVGVYFIYSVWWGKR